MRPRRYRPKNRSHISIIEAAIHAQAFIGGAYIASPFAVFSFTSPYSTALLAALSTGFPLLALAIGSVLVGGLGLYAVYRRGFRFRSAMMFSNVLIQIYVLSAILLIQGLLPLTWLLNVTVLIISIVVWTVIRRMTAVFPRGT